MPRRKDVVGHSKTLERLYAVLLDFAERGLPCPRNGEIIRLMGGGFAPSSIFSYMAELRHSGRIEVTRVSASRRKIKVGTHWTAASTQSDAEYYKETGRMIEPPGVSWPDYSSHDLRFR